MQKSIAIRYPDRRSNLVWRSISWCYNQSHPLHDPFNWIWTNHHLPRSVWNEPQNDWTNFVSNPLNCNLSQKERTYLQTEWAYKLGHTSFWAFVWCSKEEQAAMMAVRSRRRHLQSQQHKAWGLLRCEAIALIILCHYCTLWTVAIAVISINRNLNRKSMNSQWTLRHRGRAL